MRVHEFHSELWLPRPPEEIFPFFSNAGNLDAITPPWLHFRIITPQPVEMRTGTLIDYALRLHGLPLRWRTRIREWASPHRFVDEQLRGPYLQWIHTHTFEPCRGGTRVHDLVRYAVPLDFIVHASFVRPDIERIFAFRRQALQQHLKAGHE